MSEISQRANTLAAFLDPLTRAQLQAVIERLASDDEAIAARIHYLVHAESASEAIAHKIASLDRARLSGTEGSDLVRTITGDIEMDVVPRDPVRALTLIEALMECEVMLIDRCHEDDFLGMAFEQAATLWLKAARQVRDREAGSMATWMKRFEQLGGSVHHSLQSHLLKESALLFDVDELRAVFDRLESLTFAVKDVPESQEIPFLLRHPAWSMVDLAQAMRDPPLYARALRVKSPQLLPHQRADIVRFYLDCKDAQGALHYLETTPDGPDEYSRRELLDRIYEQLGDRARQIELRRARYIESPSVWTYQALQSLLDAAGQEALRQEVSERALSCSDLAMAVELLLTAGHFTRAQELLLTRWSQLGRISAALERLAAQAIEKGYPLIAIMLWRAGLNSILDRGSHKAYAEAAGYLLELRKLAGIDDYGGLPHHWDYERRLRELHDRKTSFWPRVSRH